MHFSERQVNGVWIIDLSGDVTLPAEKPTALRERVVALLLQGERQFLLNLADLQHMDSSCLGEIVESYKIAASNGGLIKLAQVGPHLQNLLHTTSLDKIFESYETEKQAIASFGERPPAEPMRTVLSPSSLWSDE